MKYFTKAFIFILLMTFSFISEGQQLKSPDNYLKVGAGITFLGTGDLIGRSLNLEYWHKFNEHLGISPRIMFTNGGDIRFNSDNIGSKDFIQTYDLRLQWYATEDLTLNSGYSFRIVNAYFNENLRTEYAHGFTYGFDAILIKGKRADFGMDGTMQAFYTNGDIAWTLGFYLRFK